MNIYYVIKVLFDATQAVVSDCYVLHKWFKYNIVLTAFLRALVNVFFYVICNLYDILSRDQYVFFEIIAAFACLLFIKRDKLVLAIFFHDLLIVLYNLIATILMLIVSNIYGLISGNDADLWFTIFNIGLAECVMLITVMSVTCFLICLISKKLIPIVERLEKRQQLLLCVTLMIPIQGYSHLRHLIPMTVEHSLSAGYVVLYGLIILIPVLCIIIFLGILYSKYRLQNQKISMDLSMQSEYYHQILGIQEQLREIKHYLSNIKMSSSVDGCSKIKEYCRKVKEELKSVHI